MKKIIYPIILLLLASFVISESFELKLISYEPDSDFARIQIKNLESKTLSDITFTIDSQKPVFLVQILGSNSAIVHSVNIPSGNHKITITSKEGITTTQNMQFSKSVLEVKDDLEKRKLEEKKTEEIKALPQITETSSALPQKKDSKLLIILIASGIFIILLTGGFLLWYFKFRKPRQQPQKDSVPLQPIRVSPSQFRTKTPEQLKQQYFQKQKNRREIFNQLNKK